MRIKEFLIPAVTADDDGIATTFQPAAGVALTLLATTLSPPREIEITSAGNVSGATFTIVGRDRNGNRLVSAVTGPSASTVRSRGVFATIESITPSATVAVNTIVGWGSRVAGPWVHVNTTLADGEVPRPSVYVSAVGGASEYTIETTNEQLNLGQGDITTDPVVGVAGNAISASTTERAPDFEVAAFFRVVKSNTGTGGLRVRIARPSF
jgi:hypothetical protein